MKQKLDALRLSGLLFVFLLFWGTMAQAQNGQFDVRFTVKNFDCANNKAVIQLQVKARDAAHTFKMGDANYRFDFDPRVIRNPAIVSQENFSNLSPASDFNYLPQNLNGTSTGTTIGTVSLNTFYSGSGTGAKTVGTEWLTVACIRFDVQDPTKCIELLWHTDTQFPVTGMNEVVLPSPISGEYELAIVVGGGLFGNLTQCIPSVCSGILALDDVNTTLKNMPVSGNVLTNDQSSGGAMTATTTPLMNTTNGTLTINPDGSYTYTPNAGFVGDSIAGTFFTNQNPVEFYGSRFSRHPVGTGPFTLAEEDWRTGQQNGVQQKPELPREFFIRANMSPDDERLGAASAGGNAAAIVDRVELR
ncbi:MAG: hypothetical protein HC817_03410, partial [Saprospiraceae bacterium]|nr:hypothetical protein [Saprospiraceae bacterium]